jgi:hypothetical protein
MSAKWEAVHARPLECPGGCWVGHCEGDRRLELMPGPLPTGIVTPQLIVMHRDS